MCAQLRARAHGLVARPVPALMVRLGGKAATDGSNRILIFSAGTDTSNIYDKRLDLGENMSPRGGTSPIFLARAELELGVLSLNEPKPVKI